MFDLCPHAFCCATQGLLIYVWSPRCSLRSAVLQFTGKCTKMKSAMKSKAMKTNAKAMTKSQLADQLATKSELKKKEVLSVLQNLSEIGASEVTNTGKCLAGSLGIRFGLTFKQMFFHLTCWTSEVCAARAVHDQDSCLG